MKAQITTKEKIHKEFPSGKPCYITRVTPTYEQRLNDRVYHTFTYESQKENYEETVLDENSEPLIENDKVVTETKTRTILGRLISKSDLTTTKKEVNQLGALIKPNLPENLTEWEEDVFKRAFALQFKTINDADLGGSFMETDEWELDMY